VYTRVGIAVLAILALGNQPAKPQAKNSGCVANRIEGAQGSASSWHYAAKPKMRFTKRAWPMMSPLFTHRICPLRSMCMAS
jgi:hypothetical protein